MSLPRIATFARRTAVRLVLVAVACASIMPDAWAFGPRERRGGAPHGAFAEARGARQMERMQQRGGRASPAREAPQRAVEPPVQPVAPPQAQPEAAPPGRPGRLTPDERRALRQQINEAGRDVYRPNRP